MSNDWISLLPEPDLIMPSIVPDGPEGVHLYRASTVRRLMDAAVKAERERCASVCRGIAAGYAGTARRLAIDVHSAHAAGQRDGANECTAEILKI